MSKASELHHRQPKFESTNTRHAYSSVGTRDNKDGTMTTEEHRIEGYDTQRLEEKLEPIKSQLLQLPPELLKMLQQMLEEPEPKEGNFR